MRRFFCRRVLLAAATCFVAAGAVSAESWGLQGEYAVEGYSNDVTGPGAAASSFLTEKGQIQQTLRTSATRKGATATDRLVLDLRSASDRRVEPDKFDLQRFYYHRQSGSGEFRVGDVLGQLSPYSLSRSLKGAQASASLPGAVRVFASGGIVKPRWSWLWENNVAEQKDVYVAGAGIESDVTRGLRFGVNHAVTDERRADGNTTTAISRNHVTAATLELEPWRALKMDAEWAASRLEPEHGTGAASSGAAQRYQARLRSGPSQTQARYERVGKNFATLSGAAQADREQVGGETRLNLGGGMEVTVGHDHSRDNVSDDPGMATERINDTRFVLGKTGFPGRRAMRVQGSALLNNRNQPGSDSDRRTLAGSLEDRLGPVRLSGSYENRKEDDKSAANADRRQDVLIGQASGRFAAPWGGTFRPGLKAQYRREKSLDSGTASKTALLGGSMALDWRKFSLSGGYDASDTNRQAAVDDQDQAAAYATVAFRPDEKTALTADVRRTENRFAVSGRNYTEETARLALSRKF